MTAATVAAVTIAGLAVVTAGGGMIALAYRTGRLVGKVETLIVKGDEGFTRLEHGLGQAVTDLKQHLAWHAGNRTRR